MKYKAVAFDYNGTLVDDWKLMFEVILCHIAAGLGVPPTVVEYLRTFEPPYVEYIRKCGSMIPESRNWSIWDELSTEFQIEPHQGAEELLRFLTWHGIPCYVITANQRVRVNEGLIQHGLKRYFRALISDDERKEAGIRKVLEEHKLHPSEMIYIGDMRVDMQAAKATGVVGVGIGSVKGHESEHCEILREAGATHAFRSMSAFHNALMNGL